MKKIGGWLIFANLLIVLGVVNFSVWQKERIVTHGRRVLLRLGVRDPRSLMQGDYMELRFAISNRFPKDTAGRKVPHRGTAVVRLEANDEARFVRLLDEPPGGTLGEKEILLRYWRSKNPWQRDFVAGAENFMFEEGRAEDFAKAVFGELRVDAAGRSVLVGLCDADGKRIK